MMKNGFSVLKVRKDLASYNSKLSGVMKTAGWALAGKTAVWSTSTWKTGITAVFFIDVDHTDVFFAVIRFDMS